MSARNKLILGDVIAIAILTVIGFASHYPIAELISFMPRMGTTFFPALIGWFLLAPQFGLFDEKVTSDVKAQWRVIAAMALSAPLAVILRAAMLYAPALPLFALIFGGSNALGMLIWRLIYWAMMKK